MWELVSAEIAKLRYNMFEKMLEGLMYQCLLSSCDLGYCFSPFADLSRSYRKKSWSCRVIDTGRKPGLVRRQTGNSR